MVKPHPEERSARAAYNEIHSSNVLSRVVLIIRGRGVMKSYLHRQVEPVRIMREQERANNLVWLWVERKVLLSYKQCH